MRGLVVSIAWISALASSGRVHAASDAPNVLHVLVSGITSARGHVRVDICPAENFLKDCPYSGAAPAQVGVTIVTIEGVPPGTYAAQAYQDKNDNRTVDRDFLGIPTEGVGFSNDPPIRFHAPSFRASAFSYDGGESSISLRLRHFIH